MALATIFPIDDSDVYLAFGTDALIARSATVCSLFSFFFYPSPIIWVSLFLDEVISRRASTRCHVQVAKTRFKWKKKVAFIHIRQFCKDSKRLIVCFLWVMAQSSKRAVQNEREKILFRVKMEEMLSDGRQIC